jgi:hypothetical protein
MIASATSATGLTVGCMASSSARPDRSVLMPAWSHTLVRQRPVSPSPKVSQGRSICACVGSQLQAIHMHILPHRVVVWVILADFDRLLAVVVAAVGMWATLLQRCPHAHSGRKVGELYGSGLIEPACNARARQRMTFDKALVWSPQRGGSMQVRILSRR